MADEEIEFIQQLQDELDHPLAGHNRARIHLALGSALQQKSHTSMSAEDLRSAIQHFYRVLNESTADQPHFQTCVINLASAYRDIYRLECRTKDLQLSVLCTQCALGMISHHHDGYDDLCEELILQYRLKRIHKSSHIDEVHPRLSEDETRLFVTVQLGYPDGGNFLRVPFPITLCIIKRFENLLELLPLNDSYRSGHLLAIANMMLRRYLETGDMVELHRALQAASESAQCATISDSEQRILRSEVVANWLFNAYKFAKDVQYLKTAVTILEAATALVPEDHSKCAELFQILSLVYQKTYEATQNLHYLELAIGVSQIAFELTSEGQRRDQMRRNLVESHFRLYKSKGTIQSLIMSLNSRRQVSAINFDESPHSTYPGSLDNVGQHVLIPLWDNIQNTDVRILLAASAHGHEDVVRVCLARGVNVNAGDEESVTALQYAAYYGRIQVVQILLREGADIHHRPQVKGTALHLASTQGHLDLVRLLIHNGADVNFRNSKAGEMPLHCAAQFGNEPVLHLLCQEGADIAAQTLVKNTALHSAAGYGMHETVKTILSLTSDISPLNASGFCPLALAAMGGHLKVVQCLLENGAHVSIAGNDGRTPLHMAAIKGFPEVVAVLLQHGALGSVRDVVGRTPLLHACVFRQEDVVLALLKHGTKDIDTVDHYGSTPLSMATRHGHLQVMRLLLRSQAGFHIEDTFKQSPLLWALREGHAEAAQILQDSARERWALLLTPDLGYLPKSVRVGSSYLICDVCTLKIGDEENYEFCASCSSEGFDICSDCLHRGARCLVPSHELESDVP